MTSVVFGELILRQRTSRTVQLTQNPERMPLGVLAFLAVSWQRFRSESRLLSAFSICGWSAIRLAADDHLDDENNLRLTLELESKLERMRNEAINSLNIAIDCVRKVAGKKREVSLLSAWEGLGGFSGECCHAEPVVLTRAWRLIAEDPVTEAMQLHPEALVDEVQANGWHTSLAGTWLRREEML